MLAFISVVGHSHAQEGRLNHHTQVLCVIYVLSTGFKATWLEYNSHYALNLGDYLSCQCQYVSCMGSLFIDCTINMPEIINYIPHTSVL